MNTVEYDINFLSLKIKQHGEFCVHVCQDYQVKFYFYYIQVTHTPSLSQHLLWLCVYGIQLLVVFGGWAWLACS